MKFFNKMKFSQHRSMRRTVFYLSCISVLLLFLNFIFSTWIFIFFNISIHVYVTIYTIGWNNFAITLSVSLFPSFRNLPILFGNSINNVVKSRLNKTPWHVNILVNFSSNVLHLKLCTWYQCWVSRYSIIILQQLLD